MGKFLDKFLNTMRLNDDDYDEDYDDDGYDEDYVDDYMDDGYDEPAAKKKTVRKHEENISSMPKEKVTSMPKTSTIGSSRGKIVPMKSNSQHIDEVCVSRPTTFDDTREIVDILLSRKAAVVNLEGVDYDLAQRIIDFVSGGCYALAGNIQKVTNYIFVITPEDVEISGDIQSAAMNAGKSSVPQFQMRVQ